MFVTEIGITDLQRLFEVRIVLEGTAASLAAQRGTAKHWDEVARLIDTIYKTEEPESADVIRIDEQIHQVIYQAADNTFLRDTLVTLYALSLRLWYFSAANTEFMDGTLGQHLELLDLLRNGEAEKAETAMAAHIRAFQEEIQNVMIS